MSAIIELFPDRQGGYRYRVKGGNGEKMVTSQHYRDHTGGYRYRVKGGNGEKMVTSQHYRDHTDATRGVHDLLDAFSPESGRQLVILEETPDDE